MGTILPGDQLHFTNQNGITGNYNSATGTLALTGTATPAQYQTALESVQFSTTSGSILPQAITVLALDGSLTSNPAYEQINPVAVGPVVTASGTQAVYQWGGAGVAVDSGLEVSSDHATITGATMQITNPIVGDTLAFTNQNNITGSYNAATTTLSLTGTATPAQYQTALDSVTFSNTINAITSPRMITVAAFDANANPSSSNSISEQVNVTAPRSPTGAFVSSPAAAIIYGPGAPAAAISSGIVVSSGDGNLTGATVTISSGMQTGDSLNFSGTSQISGSYNSATGTLTLTGSASAAQYQAVLGSVTFSNATNTAVNNRSITFQVDGPSDSPTTSNSMTETVDLLAPATVMGLWVKGSAWSASFNNYLASNGLGNSATPSLGFALQTGASQSKDLPWINVNVIEAQFNEQVNVTQNSLILSGGTGGSTPSITGFSSLGNNTYAWTLSTALTRNQLEISFLATGPNAVTNNGGDGLSGNWTNGSSSFPSGNGLVGTTASSNFNFLFNELPGGRAAVRHAGDVVRSYRRAIEDQHHGPQHQLQSLLRRDRDGSDHFNRFRRRAGTVEQHLAQQCSQPDEFGGGRHRGDGQQRGRRRRDVGRCRRFDHDDRQRQEQRDEQYPPDRSASGRDGLKQRARKRRGPIERACRNGRHRRLGDSNSSDRRGPGRIRPGRSLGEATAMLAFGPGWHVPPPPSGAGKHPA